MVVFKDAPSVAGANLLLENGNLNYYIYSDNFEIGKIYLPESSLTDYFSEEPFKAYLFTVDGLKEFTTTKQKAYQDARTYKKQSLPQSNFNAVYVNGEEIASVWYDGSLIYKKVVTSFIKKTIRAAGSLDIRENTNSMYVYALVADVDRTLIGAGDIKAVYINNVKLADGAKVDFTKVNTYYLITITQLSNVDEFINYESNTITFAF